MSKKEEVAVSEGISDVMLGNLKTTAEFQILIDSGAIPSSLDSPQKLMTIIQMGKELGLPALVSINNLNIIKGRTVISSAMLGAMLKKRGIEWVWTKDFVTEGERIVTEIEFEWISIVTKRPKSAKFSCSYQEFELAGFTSNPSWGKMPKIMTRWRTLSNAVKALFPEVLMGVYSESEMLDVEGISYNMSEEGEVTIDNAQIIED